MAPQQRRGLRVQLPLHEVLTLLGQHHLGTALGERTGGGHPEEATADDDGACAGAYRRAQGQAVVEGAERMHPVGQRVPQTAQRRQDRVGTGGQHQASVSQHAAVVAVHQPVGRIDTHHPDPAPHLGGRQGDHVRCVPPGQHLRQQHPVVRGVLLLADDGDPGDPGGEPCARHPGADHHHLRRVLRLCPHDNESALRVLPDRIPAVSREEPCAQRGPRGCVRGPADPVRGSLGSCPCPTSP
ncbi:hypothetical protein Sfulv_18730 [Streptomyces fulvorobeus]|uniref:Uncharacterized protein n=1 Tax=Streptomyces fulvorobeus TaxID=284028 RepID=A0A7J0C3J9_9ACTN|nr:hypothetical protein Sfulv_18730 [Streptomyces fulvorobeus]